MCPRVGPDRLDRSMSWPESATVSVVHLQLRPPACRVSQIEWTRRLRTKPTATREMWPTAEQRSKGLVLTPEAAGMLLQA
jgi:hypothetical protein